MLRDYQIQDLAFAIRQKRSLNLSEPGTGKTPSACVFMHYLWHDLGVRTVWVMPMSLLDKNRDELIRFSEFLPEDVVIHDTAAPPNPNAKVFLMGFTRFAKCWRTLPADTKALVIDEMHLGFSSDGSARTQEFYQACDYFDYFLGMTGTLIDGRLDSAYPAIQVLTPPGLYYYNYQDFLNQHQELDPWTGRRSGWSGHEKVAAILAQYSVRHTFKEVYGDEAKIIQIQSCEMSPAQRKAYDEFHDRAMLELEDDFLVAEQEGVAVIRCRQIMAHPEIIRVPELKDGEGNILSWKELTVTTEKTGKDTALEVHLEDHKNSHKPLVIFATLKPEQERIQRLVAQMGLRVALINSDTPMKVRPQIDQDFQAGQIDVVVASPATAAVGFNWSHVDHIIFASMSYKDSDFVQGYRRAIRGVRATPLRITILAYKRSIDYRIMSIVEKKSIEANKVDPEKEILRFQ